MPCDHCGSNLDELSPAEVDRHVFACSPGETIRKIVTDVLAAHGVTVKVERD